MEISKVGKGFNSPGRPAKRNGRNRINKVRIEEDIYILNQSWRGSISR